LPFLVCEHRDLAPENININSEGKIGVMDWEHSKLYGLPALDLIFFLTHTCIDHKLEPNTKTLEERYRKMIDPNTFTGTIYNECIDYYTTKLGIPHTAISNLRLMTWIVRAYIKFFDVSTGTLKLNPLSEGKRFVINLWEEEVLINIGNTDKHRPE